MKKFLCYDTNDAATGKLNVNSNGVLNPNATIPSNNGSANQYLVIDSEGKTKWEDRLAYEKKEIVPALNIVWDGNTEGLENANPDSTGTPIYKMSDTIPPNEQFFTLVWTITATNKVYYISDILKTDPSLNNDEYFIYNDLGLVITKKDNVTIPGFMLAYNPVTIAKKGIYLSVASTLVGDSVEAVVGIKSIDQKFIPSELNEVILPSSTSGSSKKFKITVDDSGTISATEV